MITARAAAVCVFAVGGGLPHGHCTPVRSVRVRPPPRFAPRYAGRTRNVSEAVTAAGASPLRCSSGGQRRVARSPGSLRWIRERPDSARWSRA